MPVAAPGPKVVRLVPAHLLLELGERRTVVEYAGHGLPGDPAWAARFRTPISRCRPLLVSLPPTSVRCRMPATRSSAMPSSPHPLIPCPPRTPCLFQSRYATSRPGFGCHIATGAAAPGTGRRPRRGSVGEGGRGTEAGDGQASETGRRRGKGDGGRATGRDARDTGSPAGGRGQSERRARRNHPIAGTGSAARRCRA